MRNYKFYFSKAFFLIIAIVFSFLFLETFFINKIYADEHIGFTILLGYMKISNTDSFNIGAESSPFLFNSIILRANFYLNFFSYFMYYTTNPQNSTYSFIKFMSYSFEIAYKKKVHDLINIYISSGVIMASIYINSYAGKEIEYQKFDVGPVFSIGQEIFLDPKFGLCIFFESGFFLMKKLNIDLGELLQNFELGYSILNNEYLFYNGIYIKTGIKYVF